MARVSWSWGLMCSGVGEVSAKVALLCGFDCGLEVESFVADLVLVSPLYLVFSFLWSGIEEITTVSGVRGVFIVYCVYCFAVLVLVLSFVLLSCHGVCTPRRTESPTWISIRLQSSRQDHPRKKTYIFRPLHLHRWAMFKDNAVSLNHLYCAFRRVLYTKMHVSVLTATVLPGPIHSVCDDNWLEPAEVFV
jgi:hypothetical protein